MEQSSSNLLGSFAAMGSMPMFPTTVPTWDYLQGATNPAPMNPIITFPVEDPLGYPEMEWLNGSAPAGHHEAWTGGLGVVKPR